MRPSHEEIYTTIKALWKRKMPVTYTEDLAKFLKHNPLGNEVDFREIEKRKAKAEFEEMEPNLNFYTNNDDDQKGGYNLYDYWYYKRYFEYIANMEVQVNEEDEPSAGFTGYENYLLDVNKISRLFEIYSRNKLLAKNIQFKDFLSRFDLNSVHHDRLEFNRGGQIRFCYALAQIEISEKLVMKLFGIKNYPKNKKDALESRAIEMVFKRQIDNILNPTVRIRHT